MARHPSIRMGGGLCFQSPLCRAKTLRRAACSGSSAVCRAHCMTTHPLPRLPRRGVLQTTVPAEAEGPHAPIRPAMQCHPPASVRVRRELSCPPPLPSSSWLVPAAGSAQCPATAARRRSSSVAGIRMYPAQLGPQLLLPQEQQPVRPVLRSARRLLAVQLPVGTPPRLLTCGGCLQALQLLRASLEARRLQSARPGLRIERRFRLCPPQ